MQKRQDSKDILGKIIAALLAMQLFLIGWQAKTQIDQGESSLEALTWIIQQSIPVLIKIRSLENHKTQDK
jgi:hypothetical protein